MKKRILSAFLVLCMMLTLVPTAALAADPGGGSGSDTVTANDGNGVVVNKTVNYDADDYSLTMEAYVTNEVTATQTTTPLDIVLVLDVSGSMDDRLDGRTTKMDAMKSAVNGFIDQVSKNAGDADNEVTHRISIVKFADDSYATGIGDENLGWPNYYNYTQIVCDFTDVDGSGVTELTKAINGLDPAGATSVDYGLNLAKDVLNGKSSHSWQTSLKGARADAKKVVVVFTDGEPNHSSGFDEEVAAEAVNLAHDLKQADVTVYTIGMFEDADPPILGVTSTST